MFSARVAQVQALQAGAVLVDRVRTRLKKMRHGVLTAARLQGEGHVRRGRRYRAAMVTLTYDTRGSRGTAGGIDWRPRHLSEYLNAARMHLARKYEEPLRYVWVAEMQKRGVVHYHAVVWLPVVHQVNKRGKLVARQAMLPKPDQSWWPHGHSEIKWAEKAAGYLAKYISKGDEPGAPAFPKGIRISGVGGLDSEGKREARWWRAPSEAREFLGPDADIRRALGGRVDARKDVGLFWESPWRFVLIDGKPHLLPKEVLTCA